MVDGGLRYIGIIRGRRVPAERDVVLPVADNSLMLFVPVFAVAFLVVFALRGCFLGSRFLFSLTKIYF
jgi:hypothetical protein